MTNEQTAEEVTPSLQPPLRAVPMSLFPTLGSLRDAFELAESKLPITSKNELYATLATYHNTLLSKVNKP